MTHTEAYTLLLAHATIHPDENHPLHSTGFLAMLRPYKGLIEGNFHEVMQALRVVAPDLQNGTSIDRNLVTALWGTCHYARAWALEPEGMLQRNHLIKAADQERLADWLNIISDTVSNLLEGAGEAVAFEAYKFYLEDREDMPSAAD
jgi:hypothetical protein